MLPLGLRDQRGGQRLQAGVGDQADGVGDLLALAVGVEGGDREAAVGAQLDGDVRPARPQGGDQAPEDGDDAAAGVHRARAQDGGDELVGVAVEDEQGVVHVLAVVAVVAAALLLAVRRVVGAVQVEQHVGRDASRRALAFLQVDRHQRLGQAVAGAAVDRVLQAREGRLTGQVGARLVRDGGRRPA